MNSKTFMIAKVFVMTGLMFVINGVNAADRYVSVDKSYGRGFVDESFLYDDLQSAIDQSDPYDTVWVDDGFVCETGAHGAVGPAYDNSQTPNRILINKAITVRSKSGLVDEVAKKGAYILGTYGDASDKLAADSVRPVGITSGGRLVGFVLDQGSAKNVGSKGGGGLFLVDSEAENCVIRNCFAGNGGGVYQNGSSTITGCIVSNNVATGNGGGVYQGVCSGCSVVGNTAASGGGGCFKVDATKCLISANISNGSNWLSGGGGGMGGSYRDCQILDNRAANGGGGLFGSQNTKYYGHDTSDEYVLAYDCTISGNRAPNGGGMYCGALTGGTVSNNTATSVGGGLWNVRTTKVVVCDNTAANSAGANGNCLTDCVLSGNAATSTGGGAGSAILLRCVVTNNVASYRGGGTSGGTNINCRIVGNRRDTTAANGGGAAGWNGAFYNCLILGNRATLGCAGLGFWDCAYAEVVNCTFIDNVSEDGSGDFNWLNLPIVNSIAWKNCGTTKNVCGYATNCCFNVAGNEVTMQWANKDIVKVDPQLGFNEKGAVYPRARACRNAGVVFPWMNDANDPRSRDLVGAPRLVRERPVLGCCESPVVGMMLILR